MLQIHLRFEVGISSLPFQRHTHVEKKESLMHLHLPAVSSNARLHILATTAVAKVNPVSFESYKEHSYRVAHLVIVFLGPLINGFSRFL